MAYKKSYNSFHAFHLWVIALLAASLILLPNCLWHYQLGTISKIIASESGAVPDSFQFSEIYEPMTACIHSTTLDTLKFTSGLKYLISHHANESSSANKPPSPKEKVYQLAIDKLRVAYPSDDKVHTPLQIHVSPQPLNPHHQVNKKVKHGSDRLKMSGLYVQAASVEDTPLSQASTSSSTKVNTNPAPTTCSKGKAKANVMAVD
ncbi:hypothetical protein AGABI2DRAFT_119855 [Agaricus bisporus var. bisporus H97]|uniref:hypothetical protein n=1 Tax=Agaricus bisporus var. bisporus (strain H97 / ATCC MYA-4626 / FGSC 10389) TaxID=936046 RepID=UPI00029F4E96|nr:hypothetical protein AGABI2DRAFT_119855 [Agaricus bisporus var. bisporus H97]EKV44897.1 hypothetical protein AGABI2DRAFT_119855 [Agaricus bisporus var. bisporus H97]